MDVTHEIDSVRAVVAAARQEGRRIGLVPTQGALHAGHLSLIEAARRHEAFVVVSIFVNPTLAEARDGAAGPAPDQAADLAACEQAGVGLVFVATVAEMYPPGSVTTVRVEKLTETLCGPHRPGHFVSVATVVMKLLGIVQPDVAYFGRKHAQQLAVLRRMVRDLNLPVELVGCPTVRESDGLACGRRNRRLSDDERQLAGKLFRALDEARVGIEAGERDVGKLIAGMRRGLHAPGRIWIDYLSVVDATEMQPVMQVAGAVVVAAAVRIGTTRLIDNVPVDATRGPADSRDA